MEYINYIFEDEDVKLFLENNAELVDRITENVDMFGDYLKNFIVENADEFIESNVEDTRKNIRVFSEVAISQFIKEQTGIYGMGIADQYIQESIQNDINSYI